MTNYPMPATKHYYTAEKNIYYFFNSQSYQVWKQKNGDRIIIKNITDINSARIILSYIIKYQNSL